MATLVSSDRGLGGMAVAMSGDTIVAGADVLRGKTGGYVFTRPGSGWSGTQTESAKLLPADLVGRSQFGYSVALAGEVIVVGDRWINDAAGAVYVFERPSGGWKGTVNESAKLTPADLGGRSQFGFSVAISGSGDTIAAGAPHLTINGRQDQGAAYVFQRPGARWTGTVNESASLTAAGDGGWLGLSVAISVKSRVVV